MFLYYVFLIGVLCLTACDAKDAVSHESIELKTIFQAKGQRIVGSYIVILKDDVTMSMASKSEEKIIINERAINLTQSFQGQLKEVYTSAIHGFSAELSEDAAKSLLNDPNVEMVEEDAIIQINTVIPTKEQASTNSTEEPTSSTSTLEPTSSTSTLEPTSSTSTLEPTSSNSTLEPTLEQTSNPTSKGVGSWGLDRIDDVNLPLDNSYSPNFGDGGAGVTAYVIDTGILAEHNEFDGRAVQTYNGISGETNEDCHGHGTHVAGTIGAKTYGVAKKSNLVGVKVLGCSGAGTRSGVIAGIEWVQNNAVKPAIANLSLGGGDSEAVKIAVKNLVDSGVPTVVAAGNSNIDACDKSPANAPAAITVASTTDTDARSSFSNWGTCVDIFAPGSSITSTWIGSNSATRTMSGTSMAAPHVSGALALYFGRNKDLSPSTALSMLLDNSIDDTISDTGSGTPNRMLYVGYTSAFPTSTPSTLPTPTPSELPTSKPSSIPTSSPSFDPSVTPSTVPSTIPSLQPSLLPSNRPSISFIPSSAPSYHPSAACPVGTFVNNTIPASELKCQLCPSGTFQDKETYSETCNQCRAGSHQPTEGQTRCLSCKKGSFQTLIGQAHCDECRVGGYCPESEIGTCDGGFKPCKIGTFNSERGHSNETACLPCPAGTYSNIEGLAECLPCPYRLGSLPNSSVCSFCDNGFYLKQPGTTVDELLQRPNDLCLRCPDNVRCPQNTTIETLDLLPNFWRDSIHTATIYQCNYEGICAGGITKEQTYSVPMRTGSCCQDGHSGPLCEDCGTGKYLEERSNKCSNCPTSRRLIVIIVFVIVICTITILGYLAITYSSKGKQYLGIIFNKTSHIGLQAKLKIMLSFYQIVSKIGSVYGVQIDARFRAYFNFLRVFDFRLLNIIIPRQCFGSLKVQIILSATWPFILMPFLILAVTFYYAWVKKSANYGNKLREKVFYQSLHLAIIVLYVLIPSVSNTIFDAIRCQSFVTDDNTRTSNSYLVEAWSIKCEQRNSKYQEILYTFWILFTLWPVIVPLSFAGLLWYVRHSVISDRITDMSDGCRFLWQDYTKEMMFWEVIDVVRKIFLTGLIMFIDKQHGSERVFRLIMAIVVSTIYLGLLALARPYKRDNDLHLAFVSNILLIGIFLLGITIHLCSNGNDSCQNFIGLLDTYSATVLAIYLTGSMLLSSMIAICVVVKATVPIPTILVGSTKCAPNIEMSDKCHFHLFLSHTWSTGQDKTHNIARMLQLYLPGVRIWLDVDELEDVGDLENLVIDSEVFILFYSVGYFRSKNCQREVLAAVNNGKRILVLYQGDESRIKKLIEVEIAAYFQDVDKQDEIFSRIMEEEPILWLGGSAQPFALMSVKTVVLRLLEKLPHYCRSKSELNEGLLLGDELDSSNFIYPKKILICEENVGIKDFVKELEEVDKVLARNVDVSGVTSNPETSMKDTVLLLYLNDNLFKDKDSKFISLVRNLLLRGIQIILVQEQDGDKGYCEFRQIISQAPGELQALGLFNSIAIPLYTTMEYRKISLHLVLKRLNDICLSMYVDDLIELCSEEKK